MDVVARSSAARGVVIRPVDPARWREIAHSCAGYGFRQCVAYSEALATLRGARHEYVEIDRSGARIGVAGLRIKSAPIPGAGLAFVSAGPLLRVGFDADASMRDLTDVVGSLAGEYVRRRGLTLRLAPPIGPVDRCVRIGAALERMGFVASTHAPRYRTILVDLAPEPAAIRGALAQKWRNQLNGAERNGIVVEFGRDADAVERFRPLFGEMLSRKGFDTELGPDFYAQVQRAASEGDRLVVATAMQGGADVAGAVVDLGRETATYILGATTEAGMKCKAAYALHWRILMEARSAGCRWYDLGGIDPEGNPGVHHFKEGFGGVDVTAPGPYDMRPRGVRGLTGRIVEALYVRRRRGRAKRGAASS
jgi:hypothetical protein